MIKQNILEKMRQSKTCKAKLQLVLDKQALTIHKYLHSNHPMLTTVAALNVIREEFGITDDEILEHQIAKY